MERICTGQLSSASVRESRIMIRVSNNTVTSGGTTFQKRDKYT